MVLAVVCNEHGEALEHEGDQQVEVDLLHIDLQLIHSSNFCRVQSLNAVINEIVPVTASRWQSVQIMRQEAERLGDIFPVKLRFTFCYDIYCTINGFEFFFHHWAPEGTSDW